MRPFHSMNIAACAIITMLLSPAFALEDGIYLAVEKGEPTQRVDMKVTGGYLSPWTNTNDKWTLSLRYNQTGFSKGVRYTLVLNGKNFNANGESNNYREGELGFDTNLVDPEAVQAAAKCFGIKPAYREHPGHKLDATFVPNKTTFEPGDPLTVKMTIKNIGDAPFFFQRGGRNRGNRDNQFSFCCEHRYGEPVTLKSMQDFGGICQIFEIAPGKTFDLDVDVSKWFDLKPGYYSFVGTYELPIHEFATGKGRYWVDYITRPFVIEIKEKPKAQ